MRALVEEAVVARRGGVLEAEESESVEAIVDCNDHHVVLHENGWGPHASVAPRVLLADKQNHNRVVVIGKPRLILVHGFLKRKMSGGL